MNVTIYGSPIVSLARNSKIVIGDQVVLCSSAINTALGVNHPVVLRTLNADAEININRNVGVSGATICAAEKVEIGEECLIGANVMIMDTDFHSLSPINRRHSKFEVGVKPVIIGRNVFVGVNTLILKGVKIGDNSVIGAGSVVTKSLPANVVAGGNPCRILRSLDAE